MKNKAVLSVFLVLSMVLAASFVSAVKDISITTAAVTIIGNSGDKTGAFNVQNIGTEAVNVSLSVVSPITGPAGRTIDVQSLHITPSLINPGNTASGQFFVDLDNVVMGEYIGMIRAQVQNDAESATVVVNVTVTDNGQSFVVLSPSINITQSDATIYQTVKVQNNANKDLIIVVGKEGFNGMTFTVDKIGIQALPAFGTIDIISSVVIPPDKSPATYTATINATGGTTTRTANLGVTVLPTYKVGVSELTISDVDPGQQKAVALSVQNRGNLALANVGLTNLTLTDSNGDRINVTFSPSAGISIGVGAAASVTATADVAKKVNPGRYTGQVTIDGSGISQTFNANVDVNSILKITDIEVDPDTVMPGESFDVEVTVENTADDIDLEDVRVYVYMMDGNNVFEDEDDDEVEDDQKIGDIDSGDEQKVTFTFKMPLNTEDGDSFDIKVFVKGENADDGSEKFEDTQIEYDAIEVEREDHEVEIYKANLESSTLSCVKTTYIDIGLRDIGANDEDVILTIKNDQLGIRVQDTFEMSSDYDDDDFEVEKSYLLDFSSAPAGTYPISIIAENDDNENLGSQTVSVIVQDCGPTTTGTPTGVTGATTGSTTGSIDVLYPGSTGATVPGVTASPPSITKAKSSSWTDNPLYLTALGLANLLLLVLLVLAVMYLVGSRD